MLTMTIILRFVEFCMG